MSDPSKPVDRDTPYLLPPSLQDWLPQEHLARFVVEIVDRLDLSELERAYRGRGKTPYHPSVMVALLFYGYATGVFSSRKLEQATYDSVSFVVSHFISSSFAGLHRAEFSQCATIVGCHVVWPESRKAATRLLRCAPALWVTQSRPHDEGLPWPQASGTCQRL